jgi:hypothetical protein
VPPDPATAAGPPTVAKAPRGQRIRPVGGAAAPPPDASAAKAAYVLAVLEEVALDVNEKVRQREESVRLMDQLGIKDIKAAGVSAIATAVLGPAAKLVHEVKVELRVDATGHPVGLTDASGRLSSWGKKLALARRRVNLHRPGKLFVFRDRLLIARLRSEGGGFQMLVCWALDAIEVSVEPCNDRARSCILLWHRDDRVECTCEKDEASRIVGAIHRLHDELRELRRRQLMAEPQPLSDDEAVYVAAED